MKSLFLLSLTISIAMASCNQETAPPTNSTEEWIQLFNKKDLSGWEIKLAKHDLNDNFNNTFRVTDSTLKIDYSDYQKFDGEFGHIYYKEPFSYYRIRTVYRFTGQQLQGGPDYGVLNSGIMLHSQSAGSQSKNQTFPVSLEMQLLANNRNDLKTTGNLCTPGTEVQMKGLTVRDHCTSSSSKNYSPDYWVTAEAIVLGDSIVHHVINGDTVLTYEKPVVGGGFVSRNFNWTNGGFGADSVSWIQKQGTPLKSGYISLQAESQPLEFRKVELLNLEGCMDKTATNYKSYYMKADNSKCKYK